MLQRDLATGDPVDSTFRHPDYLRIWELDGCNAVVDSGVEPATASDVRPLVADAYGLTERELEITERVSRGLPTGEIAQDLVLSPHTVRDHIKTVFDKVGVTSRGQLVAKLFTEQYEPAATSRITRVRDR